MNTLCRQNNTLPKLKDTFVQCCEIKIDGKQISRHQFATSCPVIKTNTDLEASCELFRCADSIGLSWTERLRS